MRRKASEKVSLYGQPLTENKRGQEAKTKKRKRKERHLNLCANRKWFSFGNGSWRKQHLAKRQRRPICQMRAN